VGSLAGPDAGLNGAGRDRKRKIERRVRSGD